MNKVHTSTLWLGLGFILVLSLLAGLGLFSINKLKYINQHLYSTIDEIQTKIILTVTMRRTARERTVNLQHLIILDDPFDKDDEWMLFNHNGAEFANARLSLLNMSHSIKEETLLNLQGETTADNVEIQMEIAELAIENRDKLATELLIKKAIPIQIKVFKVLDDLYQYYTELLYQKKQEAESEYKDTYQISWLIGIISVLLGSLIAYLTIKRMIKIQDELISQKNKFQQSQQQLQMALDANNDGLWDWDIKNNIIHYSPRWLEMFGYLKTDDLDHLFFWEKNIHKDDRTRVNETLSNHLKGKIDICSAEYRLHKKDNNWIWVLDRAKITEYDSQGNPVRMVGTHTDISDRKKIENELVDKQRFFKGVLDDMQTSVMVLEPEGTILFVNNSPLSDIGFNNDTLNLKFWECSIWAFSEDLVEQIQDYIKLSKNGHNILEDIELKTGLNSTWISLSIHPVYNVKNEIEYLVPECQIITDRILMENALRRSQKMDAIGQLSGGISHDFNNQLGIVIGYLDMIPKRIPEDDEITKKWVQTASRATKRCIDLTKQLLTLSQHKTNEIRKVNLTTSISSMKNIFEKTVTPEIQLSYLLPDDLWLCSLDESELQDTLLNLVINARDSMTRGGNIIFELSNKEIRNGSNTSIPDMKPGEYVKLSVSDNGSGMSKELLDKIFEPFFTTKASGKGTGLGLSMVYAFIKRYNGYIQINSELNHGTQITIYLPRSYTEVNEPTKIIDLSTQLPMGRECILIVDDEIDLLDLAKQYLQSLGYKTYTESSPLKAVELMQQHDDIDILFSDIVMPGDINGYELAQKAVEIKPNIKILLTTGFSSIINKNSDSNLSILNKPYRKDTLAHRIRHVLDQ